MVEVEVRLVGWGMCTPPALRRHDRGLWGASDILGAGFRVCSLCENSICHRLMLIPFSVCTCQLRVLKNENPTHWECDSAWRTTRHRRFKLLPQSQMASTSQSQNLNPSRLAVESRPTPNHYFMAPFSRRGGVSTSLALTVLCKPCRTLSTVLCA